MILGLRARIIAIASAVVVAAIAVIAIGTTLRFADEYTRALQSRSLAIAQGLKLQLERILQHGIAVENLIGFDEQCEEAVARFEGISHVYVLSNDDKVLFANGRGDLPGTHPAGNASERMGNDAGPTGARPADVVTTTATVTDRRGVPVATVVVAFPRRLVRDALVPVANFAAALGLLVLGIGVAVLLGGLTLVVTRPLRRVVTAIDCVRKGESDLSIRVPGTATGEIGILIDGFNHMLQTIESRERDLARSRDEAQAASRAKSEFLATMSHEIRTPMNGVIGMNELLLGMELGSRQRRCAELVHQSSLNLLGIINDILDFSRIESNRITLEPIHLDLRQIVDDIASMVAPQANAKHIELVVDIPRDVPVLLVGDPMRLRQALSNIIGNAVKFTPAGTVTVRVHVRCETPERARLAIEVTDTGIGMDEGVRAKLFQAFTQADGSMSRAHGGLGLGLVISHRLIGLMGGTIDVSSQPGIGSTFTVELELPKQDVHARPARQVLTGLDGTRVLVVDDNETNRLVLEKQLGAWRLSCTSCESGEIALRLLAVAAGARSPFDLLILDMQMPGMDGLALARTVRASPNFGDVRMIMLSSVTTEVVMSGRIEAGIECFLVKPARQSDLMNAIATVFATRAVARAGTTGPLPAVAPAPPVQGHALVVEDNAVNQRLAASMLRKLGLEVTIAANGIEALAALDRNRYDVIIMDCQMPEMDGFTATRVIRERAASGVYHDVPPIIALTANAMEGDRERCLQAGMDDYMSKPVKQAVLADMLGRWMHRHQASPRPDEAPVR